MVSNDLKKLIKLLLRRPEITSRGSSEIEVVDAQMEAVTTGSSDVICNAVISITSAFGGG